MTRRLTPVRLSKACLCRRHVRGRAYKFVLSAKRYRESGIENVPSFIVKPSVADVVIES